MINKKIHNLNYIRELPDDYELLLISFFVTNPDVLAKLETQWAQRDPLHQGYYGRRREDTKAVSSKTFGGSVCLMDPNRLDLGFISEVKSPVATGMYYHSTKKTLYVGSNKWVRRIRNGRTIDVMGNTLFNDIHSLSDTVRGNLLVTSTGIDGILEIEFNHLENVVWDWIATENGYDEKPNGEKRTIDRELNYQEISTTTPEHTTHINSALNYQPEKILATLFHQGQLIEIDIRTKKTKTLLDGMKCPHSIRTRRDGYLISDSRNNRVLLLDDTFNIAKVFQENYDWIIDAVELRDGSYMIGDSNNSRLVKVHENGSYVDSFYFTERKMYGFLPITKDDALIIFYE